MRLLRRDRRGAQAIEFALILPLMMTLTLGITDYAFYFVRDSSFRNAVHLAARTASATAATGNPTTDFTNALRPRLTAAGFSAASLNTTATKTGTAGTRFLELSASIPWDGLTASCPILPGSR